MGVATRALSAGTRPHSVSHQAESEAGRGGRVGPHRWLQVRGVPGTVLTTSSLHPRDVESLCPTQGHMHHITSRLLILSLLATEATGSQMGKAGTSRVHGPSWGAPAARRPGASCRPAVTPFRSCLGVARPPRSAAPSCWTLPGQSQGPILGVSRLRAWFPLGTNGGGG